MSNPVEDKRRAEELLSSPKDLHEHAVVVEAVAAALRPYCHTLHVPEKPSVIHSEAMWHLSTEVKGELKDPNTSSLQLALPFILRQQFAELRWKSKRGYTAY